MESVSPEKKAEKRMRSSMSENWMRGGMLATQLEDGGGVHELEVLVDGGWNGGGGSGLFVLGGTLAAVPSSVATA